MAKRFTETDKWKDRWFRSLRPEHKLAWLYLLDNCDHAGVIELDEELANFQIGFEADWDAFFSVCEGRIETLENGKWFLVKFIEYQYGELSEECRAHNPVFLSLKKNRVSKGYPKGIQRVQDKDKDKDKDSGDFWLVPEGLDTPEIRALLEEFSEMRKRIKKPLKSLSAASKILGQFDDVEHLKFALVTCIANDYQGLKPDYRPKPQTTTKKAPEPAYRPMSEILEEQRIADERRRTERDARLGVISDG